ncbi:hypothetical protein K6979_10640 [Xanthomonas cucurbitae]|nr:hypothetical protein [Xanthomonas cucurbitae]WDM77699.1 hypothetical protein K6980_10635 [Xanthomonas cucurbitae]WDM81376.1 hypothetical protein K6979_10640 [Xanthomonas cucurbitae]
MRTPAIRRLSAAATTSVAAAAAPLTLRAVWQRGPVRELRQRQYHHRATAGLYLWCYVHPEGLVRRDVLLGFLLGLGVQMGMTFLREGIALRAVGHTLEGMCDGHIVLGVQRIDQIIHVWIAGDGRALERWSITLLVCGMRTGSVMWHGLSRVSRIHSCRRAVRVVFTMQFQRGEGLFSAPDARASFVCDTRVSFKIPFALEA